MGPAEDRENGLQTGYDVVQDGLTREKGAHFMTRSLS